MKSRETEVKSRENEKKKSMSFPSHRTNDMPQALNNSRASLYADDAAAHCSGSTVAENINTLQDDITKLGIWCNLNLLTVNTAQTKVVHFGTKETRYPDITLNGEKLQVQETYTYLGFTRYF